MRFIDSHTHLADAAFAADSSEVIGRARDAGAAALVCVGESIAQAQASRGLLCFHLFRLRVTINRLFVTAKYGDGPPATGWLAFIMYPLTQAFSSVTIPQSDDKMSGWKEPFMENSEFSSLVKDVVQLLSPDFEVSGAQKIATAARMRVSYQCLVSPLK